MFFRKLICFLFGHKSICLFRLHFGVDGQLGSEITNWKCERCLKTFTEQWDH